MLKHIARVVVLGLALLVAGCDSSTTASDSSNGNVLTVMAGSELKDIEPMLPQIEKATGIRLQLNYAGTLEAVERLQAGDATDLAWLANNHYAMLVPGAKSRIIASERTMLTPVVLGLKASKAKELGWENNPQLTWKDIAVAAEQGKFTFGMTNPTSSNTGFSGLLGLASALSGKGDALEEKDIDSKRLAAFFKAQRLTAGSSGWLSDAFMKEQGKVDGLINYASTLQSMNRSGDLAEKLVLIYPRDGIVTADYPLMLINPQKRADYDKLVAYIRGVEFQREMAKQTLRRPVNPDAISPDDAMPAIAELSFPAKLAVVDAILYAFDNNVRLPTDSTFVLDTSGSMSGQRIDSLKTTMLGLAGADSSISGRFAKFRNREHITLVPFSDHVLSSVSFAMGDDASMNQQTLKSLERSVNSLSAGGGTAIYSATQTAYQSAVERRKKDPARFYSVVVMTDGQNGDGISIDQFASWYRSLPPQDQGIKVFTVMFGEASASDLKKLAEMTGGRLFDGRKSGLQAIFKEIRGYQ
ncbi:VWA domain-containing protein [Herbaspirillum camelliae]|uniref:VWA domain-containing protein n=1 Tax=Herbaspirillum camelliae TaxID=1892903 RepID=UPI000949FAAA|nr:VWA domain-containing protein [Herbaspirillum camelliae]